MQTGALLASAVHAADLSSLAFDEVKGRFLALFPRRSESIWKKREHKRWFTQHSVELSDQQIFAAVDGKLPYFAGARFGRQTRFAVIDIDTISPYYNVLSLVRLRRALETAGLANTHHYQSSDSGGWHVWLFFDEWVDATEVNKLLSAWLKKQEFKLGSGVLEIFPSANGLRIPLQPGFRWLSDNQARAQLTLEEAVRRFVSDSADTNEWRNAADFIAANVAGGTTDRQTKKRRSGLIPDRWKLGRQLWRSGLQQWGQRHDGVLAVEHYLWFGDEEEGVEPMPGHQHDDARQQLIIDWLERKHNGMCRHINRGDWRTVSAQVQRACAWRTSVDTHTPYAHTERKIERMMEDRSLTPRRFITGNIARYNYALARITNAFEELSSVGRTPSINEVAEKAGAHWNTVRKHWNLLTRSSSDQNPGISPAIVVVSAPAPVVRSVAPSEKVSTSLPSPLFVSSCFNALPVEGFLLSSNVVALRCKTRFSANSLSAASGTPTAELAAIVSKDHDDESLHAPRSLPVLDRLSTSDTARPFLQQEVLGSKFVRPVAVLLRLFVGIGLCLRLLL
jgi:hypothetical protein